MEVVCVYVRDEIRVSRTHWRRSGEAKKEKKSLTKLLCTKRFNKVIDFRRAKFVIVTPVTIDAVIPCSVIAFARPRVGRFRQIFRNHLDHTSDNYYLR